jgi:hypothetical protein
MTVVHRSNPMRFVGGIWCRAEGPLPRFDPTDDSPHIVSRMEVERRHAEFVAASRHQPVVLPPSDGCCGVCGHNIAACACGPAELEQGTGPYVCAGCGREHGTLIGGLCRHCHCDPLAQAETPHSEPGGAA